jgi:adenylate cyclase, class 2
MAMEIEAKMKVADLDSVRRKLKELGAVRRGKEFETNSYFDTSDESLQKSGKGLRIRVAVDEAGSRKAKITMKGALQQGPLKSREETEFSVSDPDAASLLLQNLGYHPTLSFEKRRESWEFQKCEVDLDELPYLGFYVEIEGPGEAPVMAARKSLGLSDLPLISTGYISLLARYLEQNQIKQREIRF